MGAAGLNLAFGAPTRREALEELLAEVICGSLRPLTERNLSEQALRILDEAWADVRPLELHEVIADLEHSAIDRDRWGFHAIEPARSLDDAWPHLAAADLWAEEVASTEGTELLGSDLRGRRGLFAAPLLDQHQEITLGVRSRRGDLAARNELVEANTRWVLQITRSFARQAGGVIEFDDLFQAGCLGLLRAAEKFDPSFGYKFSTYATWWIRQSIQRMLATDSRTIDVPVHMHDRMKKIHGVEEQLRWKTGSSPTTVELAKATGLSVAHVEETRHIPETVPIEDAQAESFVERTEPTTEEKVIAALVGDYLRKVLRLQPERERRVLELRYGLCGEHPQTLEEVGQRFNLTRERIRQVENRSLKSLANMGELRSLAPPRSRNPD
jgi:RNA polymerase sigma factor (sigma-70 family)